MNDYKLEDLLRAFDNAKMSVIRTTRNEYISYIVITDLKGDDFKTEFGQYLKEHRLPKPSGHAVIIIPTKQFDKFEKLEFR